MSSDTQNESAANAATLASVAYREIRRDIISGALQPSQKLRMAQMCLRYNVGLSPMREALSRLAKEGMVDQSDRRGFFVAAVSKDELVELIRTRCLLYEIAIRESIINTNAHWEEKIILSSHRLEQALLNSNPDSDRDQIDVLHREFHTALIAACGSRWIISYCEQLFDQSERYRRLARAMTISRDVNAEHRAIVQAVLSRDTDSAIALITSHIQTTGRIILDNMKK